MNTKVNSTAIDQSMNGGILSTHLHFTSSDLSDQQYNAVKSYNLANKSAYVNPAFDPANDMVRRAHVKTHENCSVPSHFDDSHVYANLSEISKHDEIVAIDRKPYPPFPDAADEPIREISGWKEYKTLGGRSYYFHPEEGIRQWKPPRTTLLGLRKMSTSSGSQIPRHDSCEASTSQTTTTEFSTEFPVKNEYDVANCSSSFNDVIPKGIVPVHEPVSSKSTDKEYDKKGIMSHSVDSGIGHSSTSYNKHGFDPTAKVVTPSGIQMEHSSSAEQLPPTTKSANNLHSNEGNRFPEGKAIRHGLLEKSKLTENGVRLKKREWINSYAYLYSGHLLFYKDQKSAEKTGKHYPAPIDVCDLRNAVLTYADSEKHKEKRRKNLISLLLLSKTEYLFACNGNESDLNAWYHALKQAITFVPASKLVYPNSIIADYCGSLQRSSTRSKGSASSSNFSSKSSFHHSIKSKLKGSASKSDSVDLSPSGSNSSAAENNSPPTRESIIERLLRFFRSRPSMESLRERGIYKPEPVFGSTLADICAHEKSLVPKFIVEVTRLIEEKGLDMDGLYRVNGNLSSVQKIRCQIDQDLYDSLRTEEDVHVLTGALKLFFRELSEPIFPQSMNREFMSAIREPKGKFKTVDELLLKLPTVNKETLRVLLKHLDRVATHSGKNRMQIHNLAIVFGPSLFCSEERPNSSGGHNRKLSQDKVRIGGGKRKDKKADEMSSQNNAPVQQSEPNQNLAYKMVVYGQIVEFILTEAKRFTILRQPSTAAVSATPSTVALDPI